MSTPDDRPEVSLPAHWTAQQAMAVHDALDAVLAALWTQYETALAAQFEQFEQFDYDAPDPAAPTQPELFDDELPF